MKRGDVYYIDVKGDRALGCEQKGPRPAVVIQNDIGNQMSPTIIVALITSKESRASLPTHVKIKKRDNLEKDSLVLTEQIRTIDKCRVQDKVTVLTPREMIKVDEALKISIGL